MTGVLSAVSFMAVAAFTLSGCAGAPGSAPAPLPQANGQVRSGTSSYPYVQHVVIVVQENRSFDNFFATYPGADGATSGLLRTPKGDKTIRLEPGQLATDSLGHEHFAFEKEFDHGKMDGFNHVDRALEHGDKIPAGRYAYRYVKPQYIKPYWTIAQNYVLGDHMFSTQGSSSFTAHQDLIAGGTPIGSAGDNVIDFPTPSSWGCDAPTGTVTSLITTTGKYLKDKGPFPCFTYATLRDLLDGQGLSWAYFTNNNPGSLWDAFDAISAVRYGSEWTNNIVRPQTRFFDYVSGSNLPAVSWVIPDAYDSDHPGDHIDRGPSWVASIVNAIGESPYWDSTAIVVVWDDWGGYYDNVPPPQLDGQGLGIRVPMLLVSAYARETSSSQPGYISHTQYEFGSILKFIENNWNLGSLGTTDQRANSLIDCFDFSQSPRPFVAIPSDYSIGFFKHEKPSGLPVDDQ
ncbi:MAG TPA: alkaline phosphatase family protein [Candidatus Cybelea sp.]|jgi:phospholipase C|nr:alkaline phosphatase family protein [Candidatus Cybelea sp.]